MDDFHRKWQIIQQELGAQAQGNPSPKVASMRTLFGIRSSVEEKMDAFSQEIEAEYAKKRKAARENEAKHPQGGE